MGIGDHGGRPVDKGPLLVVVDEEVEGMKIAVADDPRRR